MKNEPHVLEDDNLSRAWARVMLRLVSKGVKEISPLVVNIHLPNGQPVETPAIRRIADEALIKFDRPLCETTAGTIFPNSLWVPSAGREALFTRYERILPRLRKCPLNRYGIYFERLIKHGGTINGNGPVNQLRHILDIWEKGNRRRSALQALIFDPTKDHTNQLMRGFPCLQQVMFIPDGDGLMVSGVYGVQYIFDRAYGNYLGLCRLGQFMAHEMGLPLTRLQCVTTIAELGTPNKTNLSDTIERLSRLVKSEKIPAVEGKGTPILLKPRSQPMPTLFDEVEIYAQAR